LGPKKKESNYYFISLKRPNFQMECPSLAAAKFGFHKSDRFVSFLFFICRRRRHLLFLIDFLPDVCPITVEQEICTNWFFSLFSDLQIDRGKLFFIFILWKETFFSVNLFELIEQTFSVPFEHIKYSFI